MSKAPARARCGASRPPGGPGRATCSAWGDARAARSWKDAQQISSLFAIFALVPLWGMSLVVAAPDNPVWVALSICPFSAPVLMIERLGVVDVPVWQIVASLAVLALTAAGGLFLTAGLYEGDFLIRGDRPALREIGRLLGAARRRHSKEREV